MVFSTFTFAWLTSLLLVLYLFWRRSQHRSRPPGPQSLPILGHLLSLPLKNQHLKFHEWSKIYGPFLVIIGRVPLTVSTQVTLLG